MNPELKALVKTAQLAAKGGDMLPALVLADKLFELGKSKEEEQLRKSVEWYLRYDRPGLSQRIAWMAVDVALEEIRESC